MSWTSPFQAGHLIQAVRSGEWLPLMFIQWDSYEANPNQREEIKAYRDDNSRDLTRVTASGKKSTLQFKLRPLNLKEKMDFQAWLGNAMEDTQEAHEQRKVQLKYWDDEENVYKTGYFYRPNVAFKILKIEGNLIYYKEQEVKFVEY